MRKIGRGGLTVERRPVDGEDRHLADAENFESSLYSTSEIYESRP